VYRQQKRRWRQLQQDEESNRLKWVGSNLFPHITWCKKAASFYIFFQLQIHTVFHLLPLPTIRGLDLLFG
jgi:hypothetical protein